MGAEQKTALNEYEMKLIRVKARHLAGRHGFGKSDREDIEQDLALHVVRHKEEFDPSRSREHTFVTRIVDRKIISILRQRFALRRDYRRNVALGERNDDQEDGRLQAVAERRARADQHGDLAIDLANTLKRLDSHKQHLCELLMRESIAEAARRLGLTRAQLRTRIAHIRELLTDAGLGVYLNV